MYFPFLTKVQNVLLISWKIGEFFGKMFLLKLNFQNEGQFHADFLFYILIT